MIVRERTARSILSKSKVYDYVINPYTGCAHGCYYCYAHFMKRFTGHSENWGEFVDVKINAPELLRTEIRKKRKSGRIWMSGVCDPYQPLERRYRLSRQCLEIMVEHRWSLTIQTRSSLVLRDIDILEDADNAEVGLSIPTADDRIRKIFEPRAPKIEERIEGLDRLHRAGIKTFAMLAPLLPGSDRLPERLLGKVDYVLVDRMNYNYGDWVYRKYRLEKAMEEAFFLRTSTALASAFRKMNIDCRIIF